MTPSHDALNALAAGLTSAVNDEHPVYETEGYTCTDIITAFLHDYLPYADESISDEELDHWISIVFREARQLDPDLLRRNPYIECVSAHMSSMDGFTLKTDTYKAGEILLYNMPLMTDGIAVPRIGYFTEDTEFPSVYENNVPWMSIIPSEIYSMHEDIEQVKGNVLVLGLGLAYFPFMALHKGKAEKITIVERSAQMIRFYKEQIEPCFPEDISSRIRIIHSDAYDYLDNHEITEFDYCYCDLWFGSEDGTEHFRRLKRYEKKYSNPVFLYWIREFLE